MCPDGPDADREQPARECSDELVCKRAVLGLATVVRGWGGCNIPPWRLSISASCSCWLSWQPFHQVGYLSAFETFLTGSLHAHTRVRKSKEKQSCSRAIKLNIMKMYGGRGIVPPILNLNSRWSWMFGYTPRGKNPSTNWIGYWVDPGVDLKALDKRKITCTPREQNPDNSAMI